MSFDEIKEFLNGVNYSINKFGGFRFDYQNSYYDLWSIDDLWAFKEGFVEKSFENILHTTFFSINSLYYDLSNKELLLGEKFVETVKTKVIGVNLLENPNPSNLKDKAIHFIQDGYVLSNELKEALNLNK